MEKENAPLPVEAENFAEATPLAVRIIPEKNPNGAPVEILIRAEEPEFLGISDIKDQIFWRRRTDEVFIHYLKSDAQLKWEKSQFWKLPTSWDGTVYLVRKDQINAEPDQWGEPPDKNPSRTDMSIRYGRGAVCSSFEGEWTSIVVRFDADPPGGASVEKDDVSQNWDESDWKAKPGRKEKTPLAFEDYVAALDKVIFGAERKPGLVVIMAETSAGKSQIAYGLMHRYLEKRFAEGEERSDFLHVVTLEDPIEIQAHKKEANYPHCAQGKYAYRVEYTARHKKLDTDLRAGLTDCLRQKPAIVCVGEIRDTDDWKSVLEFAGTGHLVIATAHAGRLSEAMGKILSACQADTPAKRGDVARKILAMVHLEPVNVGTEQAPKRVILMTVWRRENGGANSLVSEGLDSIVPHASSDRGTLGAAAMCDMVVKVTTEGDRDFSVSKPMDWSQDASKGLLKSLKRHALKHDTEGL